LKHDRSEKRAREILNHYVNNISKEFKQYIEAIILVGSLSNGSYIEGPGRDVDVITVLKDTTQNDIFKLILAKIDEINSFFNYDVPISKTVYKLNELKRPFKTEIDLLLENKHLIEVTTELFRIHESGILFYGRNIINELQVPKREDTVVGQYKRNQGRVEGVLEGSTLIGTWFENRSGFGSYDTTGRFRFVFNVDNTFTGTRGINESLTNEGPWNGKRSVNESGAIKPPPTIDTTGAWNTNFNKMSLRQTGFNVSGEYDFNNGKLLGVIFGDTMTGTWYQDVDKDGNYETSGKFNFVFSRDGTTFKGNWGYGNSFSNGGLWNGTKVE